jgi:hypothetical protein
MFLLVGMALPGAILPAGAQEAMPPARSRVQTAEFVLATLQRSLGWYQDARITMRSVRGVLESDFDRGEEQTARRVLERAFDVAEARATLLAHQEQAETPNAPPRPGRAKRRAELQAAVDR